MFFYCTDANACIHQYAISVCSEKIAVAATSACETYKFDFHFVALPILVNPHVFVLKEPQIYIKKGGNKIETGFFGKMISGYCFKRMPGIWIMEYVDNNPFL